jgi:hypothetical protein
MESEYGPYHNLPQAQKPEPLLRAQDLPTPETRRRPMGELGGQDPEVAGQGHC